jgi:hypothetical protein
MDDEQKQIDGMIRKYFAVVDAFAYLSEFVSLLVVIHSAAYIFFNGFSIFHVFLFTVGLLIIKGSIAMIKYCDNSLNLHTAMSDAFKNRKENDNDKCN